MTDPTLDPSARYGSATWAAKRLGLSVDQFRRKRPVLEEAGFPTPDPILGRWFKASVDLWMDRRHGVASTVKRENQNKGANLDAI